MPAFDSTLFDLHFPRLDPTTRATDGSIPEPLPGLLILFILEHACVPSTSTPAQIQFPEGTRGALLDWSSDFVDEAAANGAKKTGALWQPVLAEAIDRIMEMVRTADFSQILHASRALSRVFRIAGVPISASYRQNRDLVDSVPSIDPQSLTTAVLPLEHGLLLKLLKVTEEAARSGNSADKTSRSSARVDALVATLLETPWAIDADYFQDKGSTGSAHDSPELQAYRQAISAHAGLARRGLVPMPRFFSSSEKGTLRELSSTEVEALLDIWRTEAMPAVEQRSELAQQFQDMFSPSSSQRESGTLEILIDDLRSIGFVPRQTPAGSTKDPSVRLHLRLHVDPIPARASQEEISAQDRQIAELRDFVLAHLYRGYPVHSMTVTLKGGRILVGDLVVATKSTTGRWTPDRMAIKEAMAVTEVASLKDDDLLPVDRWPGARRLGILEPQVPTTVRKLRLSLELDADAAYRWVDRLRYPDEMVRIQIDRKGNQRIIAGRPLLERLAKDAEIKLEITGHGTVLKDGTMGMSFYSPDELIQRVKSALQSLDIPVPADRVTLLACALESRAIPESFVEKFIRSGIREALLRPSVSVTPYSDTLIVSLEPRSLALIPLRRPKQPRLTTRFPGAAWERHAPGKTWIYSVNPRTQQVERVDKYPATPGQAPQDTIYREANATDTITCTILGACTSALEPENVESSTERLESSARAIEALRTMSAAGRVIERLRPSADAVLLPHWSTAAGGEPKLWFHDERRNSTVSVEITDPSDQRAVKDYFQVLGELMESSSPDTIRALSTTPMDAHAPDFLNIGLLALALTHLSRGTAMSPYQAASMWLGASQGALFLTGDVLATVEAIRATMQSAEASTVSGVAAAASAATKALPVIGTLMQLGMVGLDTKNLLDVLKSGDSHDVALAGMTLGFDAALLAMSVALMAAPAWSPAAGGPLVLLAGLAVGVTGLAGAIVSEIHRLEHNLQPLHEIDKALDSPLHIATGDVPHGPMQTADILPPSSRQQLPISMGGTRIRQPLSFDVRDLPVPTGPAPTYLFVSPWASVDRIDFVKGEVGFARSTIGESSVHRSGLARMSGNLHDWHILDGSDHQHSVSFTGKNLDLWDMLHLSGRASTPSLPLTQEQRAAGTILILLTSPALDIDFEAYSNSRAGGDLSLLGDSLLDRIERNSDLDFVGDYVTSSSMAKSADVWRYAYRRTTLSVQLDEQTRMLVLPGRNELESATFTFSNPHGERDRSIQPMDQSLVDYRLIGGGGHYSLALPADGTRRNPVLVEPSAKPGESWTIALDGALGEGGKPLRFLDAPEHGVVAFELNGQQIRYKVPPTVSSVPIAIVDPSRPALAVLLDPTNRSASLSVDIGDVGDEIDPLSDARGIIGQLFDKPAPGSLAAAIPSPEAGGLVLIQARSSSDNDGPLSGTLRLAHGRVVLRRGQELWLYGTSTNEAKTGTSPWHRYTFPANDALTMDETGTPVLTRPGNAYVEAVRFVWDWEHRRFERTPLALTERGDAWVRHWLSTAGDWYPAQLLEALSASDVTQGLDLSGPDQVPVALEAFTSEAPDSLRFESEKEPDPAWQTSLGPAPYRSLVMRRDGLVVTARNGDRFEVGDEILSIVLNGEGAPGQTPSPFKLATEPLLRDPLFATPIRRVLIQANGRPLDLTGWLEAPDMEEVLVLPEADLSARHLSFDLGKPAPAFVYDGLDLLIFDPAADNIAPPVVRVREATLVGDAASNHALTVDPRLRIKVDGFYAALPLPTAQLRAPLLTLPDRSMTLTQAGGDLVVRSGDGWDEQRLDNFFDPDAPTGYGEGSPEDVALLLRLPDKDGSLRVGPIRNGRLLEMMWEQLRAGTSVRWTGVFGHEGSGQDSVKLFEIGQTTPVVGSASFTLKAAMLSECVAGSPSTELPLGQDNLYLPSREFPLSPLTAPH